MTPCGPTGWFDGHIKGGRALFLQPHPKPFFPIEPVDTLSVDRPALPPQQVVERGTAVPGMGPGQFAKTRTQRAIAVDGRIPARLGP